MVSRTNKFIQGQGKVREFKFELGKICRRHLYLEDIFFSGDKIPPNTSVYIRNTSFFWKNVFSSIFEGSLGKMKFHLNVKLFILSWPSLWWGMVTVFFFQAKGINIIRIDACALQVLTSFPVFYNQQCFSTVGLINVSGEQEWTCTVIWTGNFIWGPIVECKQLFHCASLALQKFFFVLKVFVWLETGLWTCKNWDYGEVLLIPVFNF